jgi:hypothetical protein
MLSLLLTIILATVVVFVLSGMLVQEKRAHAPVDVNALEDDRAVVMGRTEGSHKVIVSRSDDDKDGQEYMSPVLQAGEDFGESVVSNAKFVAISAPGHGSNTSDNGSGVVYVYNRRSAKLVKTVLPPKRTAGLGFGKKLVLEEDKLTVSDADGKTYSVSLK